MKMLGACRFSSLLSAILVVCVASSIVPHKTDEESLKRALEAVTRKQRSLSRDYYNDPKSYKYHPDNENDYSRQPSQDVDENDDDLEFLPIDNGQMEMIGDRYRNFNNKRLERVFLDYIENGGGQRQEPASSSFRERLRNGGHKRNAVSSRDSGNGDADKELAALWYNEMQKDVSDDDQWEAQNPDYLLLNSLQAYYDKMRDEQASKLSRSKAYEASESEMPWEEIFNKHEKSREKNILDGGEDEEEDDEDEIDFGNRRPMYMLPTERRNVNARYPIGRDYGLLLKRFPMSKRSAKPLHHDEKNLGGVATDPKVAKDLGALFGAQPSNDSTKNRSESRVSSTMDGDRSRHDHDHSVHDHDHSEHDHDHFEHDHDHSGHDHDHSGHTSVDHDEKSTSSSGSTETTSVAPRSMIESPKAPGGQKETTVASNREKTSRLLSKRDHRNGEMAKKSVDWSQYFGIDRRKKKAALLARPGSQSQDDEWMLQRYYQTMAENLKNPERDNGKESVDKTDSFDQMDSRLNSVKNLIVEDALEYTGDGNSDPQKVKDIVMARLAVAHALEKMRRALDDFRQKLDAQRDLMKATHARNDTNHDDEPPRKDSGDKKRAGHGLFDLKQNLDGRNMKHSNEESGCPAFDQMLHRCPSTTFDGLRNLCIFNQICRACDDENEECGMIFALAMEKMCEQLPSSQLKRFCMATFSGLEQMQPSAFAVATCHSGPDSCLRRSAAYRYRKIYYQNGATSEDALDASQFDEL